MTQPIEQYLDEIPFSASTHPIYRKYKPIDWAMLYIENYGQIDGDHHKAWLIDQVARILRGTPVKLSVAKWSLGNKELRFTLGEPSMAYLEWRRSMLGVRDPVTGEYEYDYNEGIAP